MEPKTCQTRLSPHVVDRSYFPLGNYPICCAVALIHHLKMREFRQISKSPADYRDFKPKILGFFLEVGIFDQIESVCG